MEIGCSTSTGDTAAVLVDTATSHRIVTTESRLCQHVANMIDCRVRVKGIVRPLYNSATSKGILAFRVRNDQGELVPIHPGVLVVPDLQ